MPQLKPEEIPSAANNNRASVMSITVLAQRNGAHNDPLKVADCEGTSMRTNECWVDLGSLPSFRSSYSGLRSLHWHKGQPSCILLENT